MKSKSNKDNSRIKGSTKEGLAFLLVGLAAGLICSSKKIINPVDISNLPIGSDYSKLNDILSSFIGGLLITMIMSLILANIIAAFVKYIKGRLLDKAQAEDEDLVIQEKERKLVVNLFFILWIIIPLLQVSFTNAYDPVDVSEEQHIEENRDDPNDEYFFK